MALRYTSPLSRFLTDKFVWEETSKYPHYHFHIHLKIPNSGLAYNLPSCPCWTEAPQPMAQNGSKHSPGEPGPSEETAHCDLSCLAMSPSREQPRGAKPSHSGVRLHGVSEEASPWPAPEDKVCTLQQSRESTCLGSSLGDLIPWVQAQSWWQIPGSLQRRTEVLG